MAGERTRVIIDASELGPVLNCAESIARDVDRIAFRMVTVNVADDQRDAVELRINLDRADVLSRVRAAGLNELQGARVVKFNGQKPDAGVVRVVKKS